MLSFAVPVLAADPEANAGATDPALEAAAELEAEVEAIVGESDRDWEVGTPDAIRITSISYDEEADPGVGPAVEFPLDGTALAPTEGLGCLSGTGGADTDHCQANADDEAAKHQAADVQAPHHETADHQTADQGDCRRFRLHTWTRGPGRWTVVRVRDRGDGPATTPPSPGIRPPAIRVPRSPPG